MTEIGEADSQRVVAVERAWAASERRTADVLAELDPRWGTRTLQIADGQAVLCGPGLYVNRLLAVGLVDDITVADLQLLESVAADVGVAATVEVCEATRASASVLLGQCGYEADDSTSALVMAADVVEQLVNSPLSEAERATVLEPVTASTVAIWQQASAEGWGHSTVERRRASDMFSLAAFHSDGLDGTGPDRVGGLVLARSADDGRVVGCATLRIAPGADGLAATLGGMSTLPAERGRGVQGALIRHRVRMANAVSCALITTAAQPGSVSERNLIRHGFHVSHTKVSYTKMVEPKTSSS